ncbi:MAG: YkgJ family cysteine cluster protein [Cyanobacteria bacterium SIG31]|nr:YkgJ family cysteine cluster protein [Cyanobacteria bacterium SIG31]
MNYSTEDFLEYKKYLNTVNSVLEKYFEEQKEFICCKKGCSHCCERGQYPLTEIEFKYLLLGFFKIEENERMNVIRRIKKLKFEYDSCENKAEFLYRCPFLSEEKECLIYDYRALICRTFGLITQHESGKYTLPFCQKLGLNYAQVYDENTKKLDYEKVEKQGYKSIPGAYRTSLKRLISPDFIKEKKIVFGELKNLIEWL